MVKNSSPFTDIFVWPASIVPQGLCEWVFSGFPHSPHLLLSRTKEVCLVAHHINYGVSLRVLSVNGNSSHQDSSLPGFCKTAIRNADMFWINDNSKAPFLLLRTQIVSLHSRLFFLISFSLSFFFWWWWWWW